MDEHKENIHGQEDNVKTPSVNEQEKVGELAESLLRVNAVCVHWHQRQAGERYVPLGSLMKMTRNRVTF